MKNLLVIHANLSHSTNGLNRRNIMNADYAQLEVCGSRLCHCILGEKVFPILEY